MKVKIISAPLADHQGGVNTYINAMKKYLPLHGVVLTEENDYDVILDVGPHAYNGIPPSGCRRSVMVVHDIIPEKLFGDGYVRTERQRALYAANGVIAVSEWTKNDIIHEYDITPEHIRVVHHGTYEKMDEIVAKEPELPFHTNSYLLYVGKRNQYKRFRWFLRSVAPLMWVRPRLKILCTGEPFCRREWAWIFALGLFGRVKSRCFTSLEMPSVYANAVSLVYPSSYEGFGLPVLEAMSNGCPVVCSCSASLPEVAADAAVYFRSEDASGLREAIKMMLPSGGKRSELSIEMMRRGFARATLFSWNKCARETTEILNTVWLRNE